MSSTSITRPGISPFFLPIAIVAGAVGSFMLFGSPSGGGHKPPTPPPTATSTEGCNYDIHRVSGYALTRPLLSAEPACPSPQLEAVLNGVSHMVDGYKSAGVLTDASVYLRTFQKGDWAVMNDTTQFDPGSMLKIPVMMTWMRMAERDPQVMSQRFSVEPMPADAPKPFFPSERIEGGRSYTVEELIKYMILRSDNSATIVLMNHMDRDQFKRSFTELGLREPQFGSKQYRMTTRDLSIFMKALFNASYMSIEHAEHALELLAQSDFKLGLMNGLPAGTTVAHKFGESGDGTIFQLHETAIIFKGEKPYLLTVMTKGPDIMKLPDVLSSVSKFVYDGMPKN